MLDISVRNPHTLDKFTSFEVAIQTNNPAFCSCCSRTRRRYSEFCWLRKRLKAHHPLNTPPKLPKKKTNLEKSDPQFLVQRMKELEDWLYNVIATTLYLSDTALHLFLQTNLSCDQIDQYLAGKLSESVKELAERECSVETESISESSRDDQSGFAPPTHAVHEPVSIQSDSGPRRVEQVHVRSNSSPSRRGDSGLALSSESDTDSSYESSSTSLQGSSDSLNHSFPAVTLVENEIGSQVKNKLKTSPLLVEQETSPASHMNNLDSHMINHSVQTSIMCEGGIAFTKYVGSLQIADSETQTSGEILKQGEAKVPVDSQSTDQYSGVADKDQMSRGEKVHELVSQLPVETGLRYSINADVHYP